MNTPFAPKIEPRSPTFTLSVTALVLGLMIGLAWVTNKERQNNIVSISPAVKYGTLDIQRANLEMQAEVKDLREQLAEFEKAASKKENNSKLIQQSLEKYQIAAGITELTGPGLLITLNDSKRTDVFETETIIHDIDLLRVTNELWASGAEAIAINGQRIITGTPIRCVGPTIHVNYVPAAPPYRIQALGDPNTLYGGMATNGGVIAEITEVDPKMVLMEKLDKLTVPAFSGAMSPKLSTAPEGEPGAKKQ